MKQSETIKKRELASYYPNPMWTHGDWIENLVLFFDGIALLVPSYMKGRPEEIDPAIVAGLKQHGLLEIIQPEKAVDKAATEKLATALTEVITSGVLDNLAKEKTAFHELSMSRLGYYGDEGLYKMIFEELKKRGLAKESEDKVSIPMHLEGTLPRSCLVVADSEAVRKNTQANLNPATDMPKMVRAHSDLLEVNTEPTEGHVVEFDLNAVTVDLGAVPIDAVLDFRAQNLKAHQRCP
jgi:hypothetical protein